jgi:hypothetical protein
VKERLSESGEVISTSPSVDPQHPETDQLPDFFSRQPPVVATFQSGLVDVSQPIGIGGSALLAQQEPSSKESRQETENRARRGSNFIRTDLDDLDRLISFNP